MNGIFLIDKESGMTSRDVVNFISKKFKTKKVGHTGTLDPIATGVLVVCIGSATKLSNRLTSEFKEYEALVKLGVETDTLDITGNIVKTCSTDINNDELKKCLDSFKGFYNQEVPIYSAVKINGKKLYEYAREGIEVELPKRNVEIKEINLINELELIDGSYYFKFRCLVSKGTYIRSLIRDIAYKLNTYGTMCELRRTKQGIFDINNCCTLDNVSKDLLASITDAVDLKKVSLSDDEYFKIKNGAKVKNIYYEDILFMYKNNPVAIYKQDGEFLRVDVMIGGIYDSCNISSRNGE